MDMGTGYDWGREWNRRVSYRKTRRDQGDREHTGVRGLITNQGMQYWLSQAPMCMGVRGAGWVDTCASWGTGRWIGIAWKSSELPTMRGRGCLV